ncbi:MAG: 4-hydroxyphenylpyruvate dioxygenase [Pyrinomonadaceae bacterium]|nr:4-hydroxyphenylpyruvate dioxygenase [Pyrinomonadaceae bacterium]
MNEKNPLGLKKIHHVEFFVGNAKQAEFYYRNAFGFSRVAYSGLETGNRDATSYVLRQNRVNFILTTPLHEKTFASEHLKIHGDGVRDIAFQVEDCDYAFNEAVKRGAKVFQEPRDISDENGKIRYAAIHTYGDTIHSLISYQGNAYGKSVSSGSMAAQPASEYVYNGAFLPHFAPSEIKGKEVGIQLIDHIVGNVELGKMNHWADFYSNVLGFHRYITFDDKDISTEYSALMSIVMSDGGHNIKFPINEPAEGKGGKSQIQEYIDYYKSAGVQHVALLCKDILKTVDKLQKNGVEFLRVPDEYYEEIPERVGEIDENIEDLKRLGLLVDRDDEGYLLQIFTKPVEDRPTVFYEILQRKGCKGFGKGNFKALFVSIEEEQRRRGNL